MTYEEQQTELRKRGAVYVTGRVQDFERIKKHDNNLYIYEYPECWNGHVEYFLVLNHWEHYNHTENCMNYERGSHSGYYTFMYLWRYMGCDGHNYVYRLM